MSPRDLVYVGHMLDMAKKAVSKTNGLSRDAHDADENLRLSLIHLIQIIGEAARQVSREFLDRHPETRGPTSSPCATKWSTITSGLTKILCGRSSRKTYPSW